MNLLEARDNYIARSREIFDETERIAADIRGFTEIFTKAKLKSAKEKLATYYAWLKELDEAYTENLILEGPLAELELRNVRLMVVERSRKVFVSSLDGYERELANIEASANFNLSTGIAILALLISVFSLWAL